MTGPITPPVYASKEEIFATRRTINEGRERELGLTRLPPPIPPKCEWITPERLYKDESACPYVAKFEAANGKKLCQLHAELWAISGEEYKRQLVRR